MDKCFQLYVLLLLVIGGNVIYNALLDPVSVEIDYNKVAVEVTAKGPLLSKEGRLIETGFARQPVKELNEENLPAFLGLPQLAPLRYKKWDFFSLFTNHFIMVFHFADLGYGGSVQAQLYHQGIDQLYSFTETIHNRADIPHLPTTSMNYNSTVSFSSDQMEISIKQTPFAEPGKHHISLKVKTAKFWGDVEFVREADHDEVVMLSKLNEDGSHFYYNTKSYGIQAQGSITIDLGTTQKEFTNDEDKWFGGRDIGRGVWNYHSFWFWAHGHGFAKDAEDNKFRFGVNLGNGFEHPSSGAYEDSVIYGGRLHKLKPVHRIIPDENVFDPEWKFESEGPKDEAGYFFAELFSSIQQKHTDNYVVVQSKLNKVFGILRGYFINEKNEKITFVRVPIMLEFHRVKW